MKALNLVRAARTSTPVFWVAAVMAVALMSLYVQLLHDSVLRGDRMRGEQRLVQRDNAAKTGAPPTHLHNQQRTR
jgi:hypothetical protein